MTDDNTAQVNSPSYRLPAFDTDYIMGDSARGVRFLLEYSKTEETLRRWGVRSTVVVFGSARVREDGPPRAAHWYAEARKFGRIVSERGGALRLDNAGTRDNVVTTGGGPGIMEAANRGAADAGAPSIGLNIQLPHEQEPNAYSTPELTFQFHYFAMRKMHFAMRASALVVFPGGFGTFDEMFEMTTLVETGKMQKVPVVCVDRDYWSKAVNIPLMLEHGVISEADASILTYAEDAEEAWKMLVDAGLTIPPKRGATPREDVAP